MKKYSVFFSNSVVNTEVEISSFQSVEQSIPFALDLHRLSNIPHVVSVRFCDTSVLILERLSEN